MSDEERDGVTNEDDDCCGEEEVPAHMREDGLALARMEMMYDADTDHEGGDLYDDAFNPEIDDDDDEEEAE